MEPALPVSDQVLLVHHKGGCGCLHADCDGEHHVGDNCGGIVLVVNLVQKCNISFQITFNLPMVGHDNGWMEVLGIQIRTVMGMTPGMTSSLVIERCIRDAATGTVLVMMRV